MDRTKALNEAHKKWQDERSGIGFACFNSSGEQERAFAKADNIFAFAVDQILRTALSEQGEAAQPAADGWVLVPREPTDEMIEASASWIEDKQSWGGQVFGSEIWEQMIAASPGIASQAEEGGGE